MLMFKDFTIKDLNKTLMSKGFSQKERREILLKLYPWHFGKKWDFFAENESWQYLEEKGIVKIDWNHHCQCGWCEPEPLVEITGGYVND